MKSYEIPSICNRVRQKATPWCSADSKPFPKPNKHTAGGEMMLVRLSVRHRIFETNETSEVQFLNEFSSLLETFYDSAVSDGRDGGRRGREEVSGYKFASW